MSRSTRSRQRQSQLTFNPIPSSSPASAAYNQQIRERAALLGYNGSPGSSKRRKLLAVELPTPPKVARRSDYIELNDPNESDDSSGPSDSHTRAKFTARHKTASEQKSTKRQVQARLKLDGVPESTSQNAAANKASRGLNPRRPLQDHKETQTSAAASEDSDDELVTPRRRRGNREPDHRIAAVSKSAHIDIESDDDSDMPVNRVRHSHAKKTVQHVQSESDSESSLPEVTSVKVQNKSRNRSLKRRQKQNDELQAEALELQNMSGPEVEHIRSSQLQRKSARRDMIRKIQQRRTAGKAPNTKEDPDELQIIKEQSSESKSDDSDAIMRIDTRYILRGNQDDDDDFVYDDGVDLTNNTDTLPLEFSRYASMKTKELFHYAVEWMVQKKINPAFQSTDELYRLTFKKLDDEVKHLAGSKFMSAAWTADFAKALKARPQIAFEHISRASSAHYLRDKCDACNRSGHPATYQLQFLGNPYVAETLEPVGRHDDSDSDSDSTDSDSAKARRLPTRDAEGREIVPEDTTFYVGKFCMSNAETAHGLQHWRLHLYEWVCEWLESQGHSTPEKLVQRDGWSERKRRKYVNKLVDEMKASKKIAELWSEFKGQVNSAKESKGGRWT